jgi:hypothetical protein
MFSMPLKASGSLIIAAPLASAAPQGKMAKPDFTKGDPIPVRARRRDRSRA